VSNDLDLRLTAQSFDKGWHKISWTKLNTFNRCSASWMFENYAVPIEREVYTQDEALAIPGTIVQRVWEGVINDKIFLRLPSVDSLSKWMRKQSEALFQTIVFPLEEQFKFQRSQIRYFFKSGSGQERLKQMSEQFDLDPVFHTGLQPKFCDLLAFTERHKSLQEFFDKIEGRYKTMLEQFVGMSVDFNQMLSEQFIKARFGEYELMGGVDFLYNLKAPLRRLSHLQDDFIILDGKNQISESVSEGQLFFYATILYLEYRKLPSYSGFIDWSKSDFRWYRFDMSQIEDTKRAITTMMLFAYKLNQALNKIVSESSKNTIALEKIPFLEFNPSRTNCRFCGYSNNCKAALDAGFSRDNQDTYIKCGREQPDGLDLSVIGTQSDVDMV
jgi:hypothetical protein